MTDGSLLTFALMQSLRQLPSLVVCLVACLWAVVRWGRMPAARWAVPGFGLALVLALLSPVSQIFIQRSLMENHETAERIGFVLNAFGFFWSTLQAVAYGLIAAAVFSGRSSTVSSLPPPLTPGGSPPAF